jgi:signal transduction histidine kinase
MRRGWQGDAALAAALAFICVMGSAPAQVWQPHHRPLDFFGYALLLASSLVLIARRAAPRVTLAVTVLGASAYLVTGYGFGPVLIPLAIAVYTVAAHLPARRAAVAAGIAAPFLLAHIVLGPYHSDPTGVLPGLAWIVVPFALGTAVRLGREASGRERQDRARQVAYEERLRVAQEVHDVVGHGLTAITMQADVALHVLAKRPEQAVAALTAISQTSRAALAELRATLNLMRNEAGPDGGTADGVDRGPAPGLAQIGALADRVTRAGVPVTLLDELPTGPMPAAVELAAYRIVQESLTNVLRHAGPATVTVSVRRVNGRLDIEVIDTGRGTPRDGRSVPRDPHRESAAGQGIAGMRERAVALGGSLRAGPAPGGGYTVYAVLPIPPGDRSAAPSVTGGTA